MSCSSLSFFLKEFYTYMRNSNRKELFKVRETGLAQFMGLVGHNMERIYLNYDQVDNHLVSD